MSAPNPLVAEPTDEDAEPMNLEGAGVVSSVADAWSAVADGEDAGSIALDVGGAAIDALGTIADPFGSLASAGVGWLIEHVWFLHEPLDALAGDPTRIEAQARTWHDLSRELGSVAADDAAGAAAAQAWEGDAGRAYQGAARQWSGEVLGAARESATLAGQVLDSAALVATVRSTIRDLIADFLGGLIGPAIAAVAAAPFTAGGTLLAWIAAVVTKAVALARRCITMIEKLLDALGVAADAVERCVRRLSDLAERALRRAGTMQTATTVDATWTDNPLGVPQGLVRASEAVDEAKVPTLLEAAGNRADSAEAREEWDR